MMASGARGRESRGILNRFRSNNQSTILTLHLLVSLHLLQLVAIPSFDAI